MTYDPNFVPSGLWNKINEYSRKINHVKHGLFGSRNELNLKKDGTAAGNSNLLSNPNWTEGGDGLDDWDDLGYGEGGTGVVVRTSEYIDAGNRECLAFDFTNTGARGKAQTISCSASTEYNYSFDSYNAGSPGQVRFQVTGDVSGSLVSVDNGSTFNELIETTGSFTTGASDSTITIEVRTRSNSLIDSEIGEVSISEA